MTGISRRRFIRNTSVLGTSAALGWGCSDGSDKPPAARLAVVIGSGFAGSVAALRLGLAGITTIVLERGREWTLDGPDSFPVDFGDRRTTWFGDVNALTGIGAVTHYAGMMERLSGDNVSAVAASCVGGGSLVYGGVLLQPRRDIFESVLPMISYDDMDQVFYPRVLAKIGASPLPDDVLASAPYRAHQVFLDDAAAAGFETVRPAASFDWDIVRQELRGEIPAAAIVSDYIYGCNSGAKLSTDKNYLREALATGNVELRSLCDVEMISERDNGYLVTYRRIDEEGAELERIELAADYLFMAAGSLNTSKLLLASQRAGELSSSNDRIGKGWGTNGDELFIESRSAPLAGPQGGPACIAAVDRGTPGYPVVYEHSPAAVTNLQIQLAMSVPDEQGELGFDAQGNYGIRWPQDSATPSAQARDASFARLLGATGGTNISGSFSSTIWHPLGGAVMGDACDELGQLYGYRNLFVIDSSLMPGSTASANPAFTVAANAERIMQALVPGLA
ncbi:MAG: GMC family oxidoreductase [Halioglobus sp.]|nr:GMC family oxidoreductase [Halioglobus sp.]